MRTTTAGQLHINHNHILYILTGSLLFLTSGFLILNFLHPFTLDSANASSKNTDISLKIGESIMVPEVSSDTINITLDPTASGGDFKTASIDVNVSTNRTSGYTLTMSTEGEATDLQNTEYDDYAIETLSGKTSLTNFSDLTHSTSMNKWGFTTDNNGDDTDSGQTEADYYYPVTNINNPTIIKVTDGPSTTTENTATNVAFATKGKDLAAGTYSNTIVFSAIGNIEPAAGLDTITYLQDATSGLCVKSELYSINSKTYNLTDIRTGLSYPVRKLEDGNCWIVKNIYFPDTSAATDNSAATATYSLIELNTTYSSSSSAVNYKYVGDSSRGSYVTTQIDGQVADGVFGMCPKGWTIPSGGDSGQFQALYDTYSNNTAFLSSWNTQYTGVISASSSNQPVLASQNSTQPEKAVQPNVDQTAPHKTSTIIARLAAVYKFNDSYVIYHDNVAAFYPSSTAGSGLYIRNNGTIDANYPNINYKDTVRCILSAG